MCKLVSIKSSFFKVLLGWKMSMFVVSSIFVMQLLVMYELQSEMCWSLLKTEIIIPPLAAMPGVELCFENASCPVPLHEEWKPEILLYNVQILKPGIHRTWWIWSVCKCVCLILWGCGRFVICFCYDWIAKGDGTTGAPSCRESCVCIFMYTYIYIYIYIYTCMRICMYLEMCVYVCAWTCIHTCIYI